MSKSLLIHKNTVFIWQLIDIHTEKFKPFKSPFGVPLQTLFLLKVKGLWS